MGPIGKLLAWLVAFMAHATPQPQTPERAEYLRGAAGVFVDVAYDPDEAPLPTFAGPSARAASALQLAAIGAMESQLRADVQEGHCRPNECDHGRAKCWMQVQPGTGLVLLASGGYDYLWRRETFPEGTGDVIVEPDALLDERTCVLAGLHLARASYRDTGSLREYTGERTGLAPLAKNRAEAARRWLREHPPPATDAEVDAALHLVHTS